MRRTLTILRWFLTAVAAVCLGGWGSVKLWAYVSGVRNDALLDHMIRERRADLTAPGGGHDTARTQPADGELLGRIDVPRIGVSTVILQGSGERWLEQAAGHIAGTPLPGDDGNAAIAGHRDTVFSALKGVRLGDSIEVTTPSVSRLYLVDSIRIVPPTDTAVLAPSSVPRLTLVTCYPFHYIGSAPDRFVVQAHVVWTGSDAVIVPPRQAIDPLRLPASRPKRLTPVHRVAGAAPARAAERGVSGRLPTRKALAGVAPFAPPHPPKVSWLRRLFHLGPKKKHTR